MGDRKPAYFSLTLMWESFFANSLSVCAAVLPYLGMTVIKQVVFSIVVAVITVAVAEYVAWALGQGVP